MAESVARVKILAQIEGLEGFDKLKGAFKGLQQAIGPADADLSKARKEILEFGKAGAKTEQVIRGQVDALKALQGQASIGGSVYRKLSQDIKALDITYKEATKSAAEFRAEQAKVRNQIPAAKERTLANQLAPFKAELQEASVYARRYGELLAEIERQQKPFDRAVARQRVIGSAEALRMGPLQAQQALPALPDTTAGLSQRLSELNADFVNLSRGGTDWIRVSREIANVQRQLNQEFANPAVETARRRLEASRNTSSGFLAFSSGLEDRLAVQKSIERNRRNQPAPLYASPIGPPPPSELFRGIAGISNTTASNQLQLMGRSYTEVAASIRQTTAASDGSINSLRAQRSAWEALRNTLGQDKAALREVSKELATIDRQLEKRGVGSGGGRIGKGFQAFGAIASGAIFGGPEGALGGLFGAAIGGVPGAFAGAATGGAIGQARQQVGQFATYAADISKLEIALKGVTKTQDEYQRALAASASVTKDFNVPQLEATRGMTQLSAAVIGAGGKVADAEVVFRNVTAAIKASGGTSEDVQGALTALGQIFSKGKVSAEELQGQLGERLPGAVTMFAKATGRTLPQLQKDLEQGVVGLADLMKFVVSEQGLGQFEQRAKSVADSSAEAGARLTTTWNDTKRAIGEALLPLGAQIQDAFAGFIKESAPYFVLGAKAVVLAAQGMFSAISAGFNLVKQFTGLLELATKALIVFGGVQAGVFLATNISTFAGAIKNLISVMKGLLSIQKVLMAVESARAALLVIIEGLSFGATKGKIVGAVAGGVAGLAAAIGIGALIDKVTKDIGAAVQNSIKNIKTPGASELTDFTVPAPGKTDKELAKAESKARDKAQNDLFQKQLSLIEAKLNLLREEGRLTEANSVTEFEKAQVAIELADSELALKLKQLALQKQFGKMESAEFVLQARALQAQSDQARAAYQKAIKEIDDKLNDIDNKFFAPGGTLSSEELSPFLQRVKEIRTEIDDAIESAKKLGSPKAKALAGRLNAVTGADIENIAIRPTVKSLQDQIYELQNVGREITTLETLQKELGQGWYDMNEPLRMQLELLARQVDLLKEANRFRQDTNIGAGLREGAQQYVESIGTMREATSQLAQTGIKGVEDAIFSLVTTGTANFKEFAANILKDTARMIIQQLILRSIMQIIGAIGGGGGSSFFEGATPLPQTNWGGISGWNLSANGNAFGRNGIMPFAMGGIVTKPTLFRYANGGVPGTGLMGEAGPEAIIPLRRGRDGKLGVASNGGGSPVTVNVSVDASGSSVQGNAGQGEQLGRAISQAVQAELIKQRRPGGLLAA